MTQYSTWTNPSVLNFSNGKDPINAIEKKARETALKAIDEGWAGPPFDPIKLAEALRIPVSGNANIKDAKTLPAGRNKYKIEFNPNQPKARVRFSIAHEIAHTFFSDCDREPRYRGERNHSRDDDWQLEMLCNIAAAELIMPMGNFLSEIEEDLNLNKLLELRRRFDVSTEAILIRAVKLTRESCNIFCASRVEVGPHSGRYHVDYLIASHSGKAIVKRGFLLPEGTVVANCTAIGYTSSAQESWIPNKPKLYIECVGLPPYPNHYYPRVVGIVYLDKRSRPLQSNINYIVGDALAPQGKGNKIVAHVVNDKTPNWGGRGFAASLKSRYPDVQRDFANWKHSAGDYFVLGNARAYTAKPNLFFYQMIAQKGYGPSDKPRIKYSALESCFKKLAEFAIENEASIHMPRIGSGYGGGSWPLIEEIIVENLVRAGLSVTVYSLPREG